MKHHEVSIPSFRYCSPGKTGARQTDTERIHEAIQTREAMRIRLLNPALVKLATSTIVFMIMAEMEERPIGTLLCLEFPAFGERILSRVSNNSGVLATLQGYSSHKATRPQYKGVKFNGGARWFPGNQSTLFRMVERWKREWKFLKTRRVNPMEWEAYS